MKSKFIYSEIGSHYISQAGLKLKILLPQPTKYFNYKHKPTQLAMYLFLQSQSTSQMRETSRAAHCITVLE